MKYSKGNDSLIIENFHIIPKNITLYKVKMRNVDNLLHFCEKYGFSSFCFENKN